MGSIIVTGVLLAVVLMYFKNNPLKHSSAFMFRRFMNWFPLGMTYAFLYMARYNLNVSKNALGDLMSKADFGIIFGVGTTVYGLSFLLNGPMVDRFGGKKGMIAAALGSAFCNVLMGFATYAYLQGKAQFNLVVVFSILYSLNMFFQSYGAVSIIKVKSYW
jgi:MFS transporter, OPA family, glycerol-3-phosphate transporter